MTVKSVVAKNPEELPDIARMLLEAYPDKKVFALYGSMGAGKTTFIKTISKVLGVNDMVCSPSFGIVHHYILPDNNPIYHFDFYRIKKLEEAYDIGYDEYLYSGNYCFIEWPEKIEELLPEDCIKVLIAEENENRVISF